MASISQVALKIEPGSKANTKNVIVTGTMNFDTDDVGEIYRLEIKLFGEDKSGDNLPPDDPAGKDLLHTFIWPTQFLIRPFKEFTVEAAGPQPINEPVELNDEKLDEDKGKFQAGDKEPQLGVPIFLPRKDEIYAEVSLSRPPVKKRSATKSLGVGV